MNNSLIWLNEESLRINHPIFKNEYSALIYVWDNKYLEQQNYSLKRLVFIYETLCELPVDIIFGDMFEVLKNREEKNIYTPQSFNNYINSVIIKLNSIKNVQRVKDEPFVDLPENFAPTRFFQYWNKVKSKILI